MHALLTWPLTALLVWCGTWLLYTLLDHLGLMSPWPLIFACTAGIAFSVLGSTRARQLALAAGFPLSLAFTEVSTVPFWAWFFLLIMALLIYPPRSWQDASLFPTPLNALRDVPQFAPLSPQSALLDAGCGLGDGLLALRLAYPQARYFGIEASWPLRALASIRCPWAKIWQGNIWEEPWHEYAVVYVFQRPEAMGRAVRKAQAELRPGAWLISLEFEAMELKSTATALAGPQRPVWMYQQPFEFIRGGIKNEPSSSS
jgi:SAM-dependent methyltransferase